MSNTHPSPRAVLFHDKRVLRNSVRASIGCRRHVAMPSSVSAPGTMPYAHRVPLGDLLGEEAVRWTRQC